MGKNCDTKEREVTLDQKESWKDFGGRWLVGSPQKSWNVDAGEHERQVFPIAGITHNLYYVKLSGTEGCLLPNCRNTSNLLFAPS